jgi:leucyl aminopeptidase
MQFNLSKQAPQQIAAELLVLEHFEEDKELLPKYRPLDKALGGIFGQALKEKKFAGKEGEALLIHTLGKIPAQRVMLLGLGKAKDFSLDNTRKFSGRAAKKARELKLNNCANALPGLGRKDCAAQLVAQAGAEGAILATYEFTKYKKKEDKEIVLEKIIFLTANFPAEALNRGITVGVRGAAATNFARDMINEPPNVMTPAKLAEMAQAVAKSPTIKCKVYERAQIEKMGMGAYLGVAQGSTQPPKFIHLHYLPRGRKAKKNLAVIGKGLTFDSGGLNIKPEQYMTTMKCDMSGAAAVIALFKALAEERPPLEVHGLIAAAENMPSGKAFRPDDVLRAMNGKTIEIINTDAEGRLTLADALSYAEKLKPTAIIDLATLTGACVVALGDYTAGVLGNDQKLIDSLLTSAKVSGEKLWQLPFDEDMKDKLKSEVADLKNLGDRYGGAITAAMFLREFVVKTPWAHLDIAGPAFNEKGWSYNPKGGVGFGVRTLLEFIRGWK